MNKFACLCLAILTGLCAATLAPAQETFRNPALEPEGEFERAFTNARALVIKGDLKAAIKEFQKAASLRNGECPECFWQIGQIYFQMRKYKDAAGALRQALALKPENEDRLNNALGTALYLQGGKAALEEAVAAFKRAIELSEGKVVMAYYNLGHALIKLDRQDEGVEALKTYIELDPKGRNAAEVRAIIANPKMAGERFAPTFSFTSTAGEELSLENLRGKIVLLDFWATWCKPCLAEMPYVKSIWEKYRDDRFIMIGVSLDENPRALESYLKKEGITWPQYYDGKGWNNIVSRLYEVSGIPHTVLIDQDGVIRAVGLRGGSLSSKVGDLLKKLRKQEEAGSKQ
ncbi:MAG: redoxin domain-containing protein [Blastocatellia bacterium]|nr:redoxin domain-containing protein [Blastocatellia bacterium]